MSAVVVVSEDIENESAENIWSHLNQFVSYKKAEGNNLIFHCKTCMPKQHEIRARRTSTYNIKSHFEKKHPHLMTQVEEMCH